MVVVNAEQPNLWTLEQAHYLLAQMHRRNLDLRTKSLEALDPNAIAGLRFDLMRMLVEFGVTFNQADLATNNLLSANRGFNSQRRQELLAERDGLRREALRLTGEIEQLQIEKAGTDSEDAKKGIDARIAAKSTSLARVDKELEQINGELTTLAAPSGTPTATTGGATFEPNRLPQSTFDEAFKAAAAQQIQKFNQEPRLNASLQLDNFLQMQYEIISKQLSLLRDELGPGERLVFLEMPQTVNAAHHESKRKWAQSWWKIAGYTKRLSTYKPTTVTDSTPTELPNQQPIKTTEDLNSIMRGEAINVKVAPPCVPGSVKTVSAANAVSILDGPKPPEPRPSGITVKDLQGRMTKVTVKVNGLFHPKVDEVDIMLVGPQGQNAVIMSDVGGTAAARGLTITLDDAAPHSLPAAGPLLNDHTYKPTNEMGTDDDLLKPAPMGGSELSVFNGTDPNGLWRLFLIDDEGEVQGGIAGWSLSVTTDCPRLSQMTQITYRDEFVNLDTQLNRESVLNNYLETNSTTFENRMVRTVELIPRQSSLNVNDMNLSVKSGAFNFVLSTLFGLGSRLNVQRQREQFSQFVQQELYSAAFGKGAREFGWTFTPMPGTDRLMSGVRNTYAVIVVPEEATSLVLESNGCYFPRSSYQPNEFGDTKSRDWNDDDRSSRNCNAPVSKTFVVPIPKARAEAPGNDFWVKNVFFQPVKKGQRIVVSIGGENFSPQIGILVNGVPLVHSIGLAQPHIRDDSEAGRLTRNEFQDSEVQGNIERIDVNRIVFSLKMPPDFTGTPTITLIAPGRAVDINRLDNIEINGQPAGVALTRHTPVMFGDIGTPRTFRVDKVNVFRDNDPRFLTALISGAGFRNAANASLIGTAFINGTALGPGPVEPQSKTLISVRFAATGDPSVKVTLVSTGGEVAESEPVANPAFLSVSDVEVTTFETAEEGEPVTLLVRIRGTGFTDSLEAILDEAALETAVKSATEAVFTMPDPRAAAVVTLRDGTGQRVKVVVTRKTRRQE